MEARWTHRRWAGRRRGARVRCVRSVRRPAARRRRSSTPRGRGARRVSPPRLPWNHILTRDGTLVTDPASSPSRCLSQVTQEGGPAAQDEAGQAEGTRDAPEDGDRGRWRGARATREGGGGGGQRSIRARRGRSPRSGSSRGARAPSSSSSRSVPSVCGDSFLSSPFSLAEFGARLSH